jgi:putative transposase
VILKETIEGMLKAELQDHLGYSHSDMKGKDTSNRRNGLRKKTIKTSGGQIEVAIPQDRDGEFELNSFVQPLGTVNYEQYFVIII